jgi:large subunit ribosomal protein L35
VKLKTNKSARKRFRITSTGKVLRRPVGQDHFNARSTGKKKRLKRRWLVVSKAEARAIKRLLPYV